LIRLLLPLAGVCAFFAASWITVRVLRPREPRRFFLLYALLLLAINAVLYVRWWPLLRIEDTLGLFCGLLLQTLVCLTMWNSFYSLLWGFSGSLVCDIFTNDQLRTRERLIRSYEGADGLDRILARRLPNLVRGGWIEMRGTTLRLTSKGRLIAIGTLASFKTFSLGMGGGIKDR
jgi:hypothetical protein